MWQREESWPVQSIGVAKTRGTFPGGWGCRHRCPEVKVRRAKSGGRLGKKSPNRWQKEVALCKSKRGDGVGSRGEKWVFYGGTHLSLIIRLGWWRGMVR